MSAGIKKVGNLIFGAKTYARMSVSLPWKRGNGRVSDCVQKYLDKVPLRTAPGLKKCGPLG